MSSGSQIEQFMPHGMCFLWNARLLGLHVVSDAAIALAYFSIPLILFRFVRKRRDLPFPAVFLMFAAFVVACGTTHLLDIWTIWHPTYWLSGDLKALTACVSWIAAICLARVVPAVLAIKSRADLAEQLAATLEHDRAMTMRLRKKNELLAMSEQMSHVGHWRLDAVSTEMLWSDEIYRTFGLATTCAGTLDRCVAMCQPEDRAKVRISIEVCIAAGVPFAFESRIVRADGSIRDVVGKGKVERSEDGSVIALFGVLQDVTEMKSSERERSRLRDRVTVATQAGHIGIWEWNVVTDEVVGDFNLFELHGLAVESEPQPSAFWKRAIHPEDQNAIRQALDAALNDSQPFDTEYRVVWPSGETRHIRVFGAVVCDATGQPVGMLGTNWDNTEVRRLAEQVRQEKALLNAAVDRWTAAKEAADEASRGALKANRAKSDFLARMSHEIRTPMNGIIGFATLMLDSELNVEQRRHMIYLHDAGTSLLVIINDILDFSKLEAGKLEIEQLALDPRAMIDGAVAIIRPEALAKNIALDVHVADDVPQWVVGSPTRLRQVLLNLLTNALKFTHQGQIRLTLSIDATSGGQLRFEIADSGIGIPSEQQHLLFQNFSQVNSSTSHEYGGTGLGLAISRRLVEAMHGTIGVTSASGAGSTFWFTARLPATKPAPLENAERLAMKQVRRRILVVDDNAVNQIVVEALLKKDGYEVVLVSDRAQALKAVQAEAFDLILMDMQMPVMNGEEATSAIRRLESSIRNIPIVALTANAMDEDVQRCHDAGMNDHLAKPVDRALLRRTLALWLDPAVPAP
jgi:signal transduction histidine kinase